LGTKYYQTQLRAVNLVYNPGMKNYSIVMIILGAVLWGTDSLFRRPLTQSYSPVTIVFLEHCVLVAVMLPSLIAARRDILRLSSKEWFSLAFIALGGSVAATTLFTFAIKYGNPSVAVLLQKSQPLYTTLLARWLLREVPGRWFWYWFGPALIGAYLVSTQDWRGGLGFSLSQGATILAALGAALLWASSTVFGRYAAGRLPTMVITGLRFLIALPVLGFLFLLQAPAQQHIPNALRAQEMLICMALIPGLAALILYYRGLRSTIAPMASIGELAFPITAVVTNWAFLGISLSGSQLVGGSVLVASMTALTFLNTRESAKEQKAAVDLRQPA
jgi:drug/metabolite transporter (DMT)-like permease